MPTLERVACRLRVTGLVQGVGFRPFVHRLATALELCGWVGNDDAGVLIHIEGDPDAVETFRERLQHDAPKSAHIESITPRIADIEDAVRFQIRFMSLTTPAALQTRVPADRAIC